MVVVVVGVVVIAGGASVFPIAVRALPSDHPFVCSHFINAHVKENKWCKWFSLATSVPANASLSFTSENFCQKKKKKKKKTPPFTFCTGACIRFWQPVCEQSSQSFIGEITVLPTLCFVLCFAVHMCVCVEVAVVVPDIASQICACASHCSLCSPGLVSAKFSYTHFVASVSQCIVFSTGARSTGSRRAPRASKKK